MKIFFYCYLDCLWWIELVALKDGCLVNVADDVDANTGAEAGDGVDDEDDDEDDDPFDWFNFSVASIFWHSAMIRCFVKLVSESFLDWLISIDSSHSSLNKGSINDAIK